MSYQDKLKGYNEDKKNIDINLNKIEYERFIKELVEKWEI